MQACFLLLRNNTRYNWLIFVYGDILNPVLLFLFSDYRLYISLSVRHTIVARLADTDRHDKQGQRRRQRHAIFFYFGNTHSANKRANTREHWANPQRIVREVLFSTQRETPLSTGRETPFLLSFTSTSISLSFGWTPCLQVCQNSGALDVLRCKIAVGDIRVYGIWCG
jgi:hypothetical protein